MVKIVDDGFCSHLVKNAEFDGIFDIPCIKKNDELIKPENLVPFSARKRSDGQNDFICFYEYDKKFNSFIENPSKFIGELKKFKGIVSPDCSLYVDMPLVLQLTDIYFNRAVGHFLQEQGMYVIPNVRWGDERTYTDKFLGEKAAFAGIDKYQTVAIGTYGQIRGKDKKQIFREGLFAMLETIEPENVIVYGPMPKEVFSNLDNVTKFIQYQDWTALKRGGNGGNR